MLDHELNDRRLFDDIAIKYCRKDMSPSSRTARQQRLRQTLAVVDFHPSAAVLEVGCGAGFSATYLRGQYSKFVGVDYSERLISLARTHNAGPNVRFDVTNIKDFDIDDKFDVIFMIGVLHHIDQMDEAVTTMTRLLRPGGWLVANEPHPSNLLIRGARSIRKRFDRSYSDDQSQLSAGDLRTLFEHACLDDIRVLPQGFLSTPFAEVVLAPQFVTKPLSHAACLVDSMLETVFGSVLRPLSWNLVIAGRQAGRGSVDADAEPAGAGGKFKEKRHPAN